MEKLFVPKAQSIQLRELGFDEPCLAFYNGKFLDLGVWDRRYPVGEKRKEIGECPQAPTFAQAFTFFREKYELRNSITDFIDDTTGIDWDYEIAIIGTDLDEKGNYTPLVDYSTDDETRKFKTYEEAELACLDKLIEIVKNK
jgi:hypothetical protein